MEIRSSPKRKSCAKYFSLRFLFFVKVCVTKRDAEFVFLYDFGRVFFNLKMQIGRC